MYCLKGSIAYGRNKTKNLRTVRKILPKRNFFTQIFYQKLTMQTSLECPLEIQSKY